MSQPRRRFTVRDAARGWDHCPDLAVKTPVGDRAAAG